ncbi:hypothetical protein A2U01_0036999, partial [Trifolium medium]|nr:hypothetical protein [Trifolium medium]
SANDYKEALEGINSLCDKMNIRREGKVNGNNKTNKSVVGDPHNVKAKGAPKLKKSRRKQRSCTHCRMSDHAIQRCPELAGIDGDEKEGEEEEKEKKEDEDSITEYESNRLNVSISRKINDKKQRCTT